ncbi:hypothetical protein P152DRAFT_464000 [Eremomyces bilateralis CBS 781.70]|uniref:HNH nuclease domain-containing protein n=1 Tax=Eremomyces bilateralis CBS 781.70 TaxID=1392243 RepID=A0A6G1GEG4_9PEZI|nr:uncharacterized protein P152DRAFT_464000 [Eremomyces bilateralis CBS 781.70]KAF1816448.1 hypothetical protein P152DRAFT_464000 [Eremomyces bilateralis CBS 781.70]
MCYLNLDPCTEDRSRGRDIHIYDVNDRDTVLGGLILTNGITNANFFSMVEILVLFTSSFELRDEDDTKIERNDSQLQPGKYYITAADPFSVNNEPWLLRTISHTTGTRVKPFCAATRARDRRCVISGNGYDRGITIPPEKGEAINSVQNGLLLRTDIHELFDMFNISINPDDNYNIVFFTRDANGLAGKCLDKNFRGNLQRPVDQVLRWHFRQAALANMRDAGEPRFEHDFPSGSDIVGDILHGPKAAGRMELELFNRLVAQVDVWGVSSS